MHELGSLRREVNRMARAGRRKVNILPQTSIFSRGGLMAAGVPSLCLENLGAATRSSHLAANFRL